jgi:hypothetical protein
MTARCLDGSERLRSLMRMGLRAWFDRCHLRNPKLSSPMSASMNPPANLHDSKWSAETFEELCA